MRLASSLASEGVSIPTNNGTALPAEYFGARNTGPHARKPTASLKTPNSSSNRNTLLSPRVLVGQPSSWWSRIKTVRVSKLTSSTRRWMSSPGRIPVKASVKKTRNSHGGHASKNSASSASVSKYFGFMSSIRIDSILMSVKGFVEYGGTCLCWKA